MVVVVACEVVAVEVELVVVGSMVVLTAVELVVVVPVLDFLG